MLADAEKKDMILRGLAACLPETDEDAKIGCKDCPYGCCEADAVRIPMTMLEDVRALLKAQEPRVMTLEEIESGKHPFAFLEYRVEDKDKDSIKSIIRPVLITHTLNHGITMMHSDDADLTEWKKDYNKTFRLWNNDPTDAQKEATAWN